MAMDELIDSDPEGLETGNADWKHMFREHFSRAGQFLDLGDRDDREAPIVYLERQVVPAATINTNLEIVAANQLFVGLIGDSIQTLSGLFSTPTDERRFFELTRSNAETPPVLVSLSIEKLNAPLFVVASVSQNLDIHSELAPLVTIRVAKATWNPALVPLLETAYNLTVAEIEVLQGLVELGSLNEVAEQRGRSIRTVRTQMTHIFGKLGISSQTELALFLATLTQLMSKERHPSDISKEWSQVREVEVVQRVLDVDGRKLSYIEYGDPNGDPVFMVHSTTPPEMTPDFRRACHDAGLRMIAAHKPGISGGSTRPAKHGPEELVADYLAVLAAENVVDPIICGHCSGGLYALELAKNLGSRPKRVLLLDTGVPLRTRRDLMRLPKTIRRTFIPARYMPEILLVPHRIFAANFRRSPAGESRVVDYFFNGSPHDQELTRVDRKYYEITRQIIEYSFSDVDRLVNDVRRWANDWSDKLALDDQSFCAFVHGAENTMFKVSDIEERISGNEKKHVFSSAGMGQLQVYQDSSAFLEGVNWLRSAVTS